MHKLSDCLCKAVRPAWRDGKCVPIPDFHPCVPLEVFACSAMLKTITSCQFLHMSTYACELLLALQIIAQYCQLSCHADFRTTYKWTSFPLEKTCTTYLAMSCLTSWLTSWSSLLRASAKGEQWPVLQSAICALYGSSVWLLLAG